MVGHITDLGDHHDWIFWLVAQKIYRSGFCFGLSRSTRATALSTSLYGPQSCYLGGLKSACSAAFNLASTLDHSARKSPPKLRKLFCAMFWLRRLIC